MSILAYPPFGGIWSVVVTDFIQMFIRVPGLAVIACLAAELAGGADKVIALASSRDMFRFLPEPSSHGIAFFVAAAITMMPGSMPQQGVFKRVTSAKDVRVATRGPVSGGARYIRFAFVPMCLVTGALLITPEQAAALLVDDPRKVLPTLVLEPMPFVMQVIFFGALRDMRIAVPVFSACVCAYAIAMQGTPIYELVPAAYPVTLVGAFVPLLAGPYRPRGAMRGAIFSIVLGLLTWGSFLETSAGEAFPARLAGVLASAVGMLIGSVRPQALRNHHDRRVPAH